MLAHADRRVQTSRGDARKQSVSLLLAAVGQQAGCDLAVGDPVRGNRRAVGQQLLGHHVAVQVAESVPAVLGGDGQTDEPGVGEPRGEGFVPSRSQESTAGCQPNSARSFRKKSRTDARSAVSSGSLTVSSSNTLTGSTVSPAAAPGGR